MADRWKKDVALVDDRVMIMSSAHGVWYGTQQIEDGGGLSVKIALFERMI